MQLENQDRASFITPRLRVFLSVDLVGSTEYKIRSSGGSTDWSSAILQFYSDFQVKFFENWEQWTGKYRKLNNTHDLSTGPKLWKALGDELVFWKECHSAHEVIGTIQVWRKTLIDFKKSWTHKALRFKSGAWLVGSPIRNWEVAFLREDRTDADNKPYLGHPITFNFHMLSQYYDPSVERKIDIDFVGPSMDCGFRLLSLVNEEQLILSADLAYIMVTEFSWWDDNFDGGTYPVLNFHLGKSKPLKGVTAPNIDYPIVWLSAFADADLPPEIEYENMVRDCLDKAPQQIDVGHLSKILTKFLNEVDGFPEEPYICRPTDDGVENAFRAIPPEHIEFLNKFRRVYVHSMDQDASIIEALTKNLKGSSNGSQDLNKLLDDILSAVDDDPS